jgi:CyaY protein
MAQDNLRQLIDTTLENIERAVEDLDMDQIDLETSDGILTIEFDDGIKFILSRQSATNQIWLAEPQNGWRFDHDNGKWISPKNPLDLISFLEKLMTNKLGQPIKLSVSEA